MDITNNLDNRKFWVKREPSKTSFGNENQPLNKNPPQKNINSKTTNEIFLADSRKEFVKKLQSKNSLPFMVQLIAQNEISNMKNAPYMVNKAYSKSKNIAELIYGSINSSYLYA